MGSAWSAGPPYPVEEVALAENRRSTRPGDMCFGYECRLKRFESGLKFFRMGSCGDWVRFRFCWRTTGMIYWIWLLGICRLHWEAIGTSS